MGQTPQHPDGLAEIKSSARHVSRNPKLSTRVLLHVTDDRDNILCDTAHSHDVHPQKTNPSFPSVQATSLLPPGRFEEILEYKRDLEAKETLT
eukprot:1393249-Amorphochlora_amoeboformis.AAC.3